MDNRIVKMALERLTDWGLNREELAELLKSLIAANGFTAADLFGETVSAEAKTEQTAKARPVTLARPYGPKLRYPVVYKNSGISEYAVENDVLTGIVFQHSDGRRFVWRAKLDMVRRSKKEAMAYAVSLPLVLGKRWRIPDDKHCRIVAKDGQSAINAFLSSVGADTIPRKAILTDVTDHAAPPHDWFCAYIAELD
ncbi:MAG: hypothetical protein IJ479_05090 [Alphaproteobacteria bacterium]|nr:hypothetical protein [Alphaproteobacteria bacterium]